MKEYKVPKRKQPVFSIVKKVIKPFFKVDEVINTAGEIPDKCIIVSNHSAKSGPMAMEMYFPKFTVKWGAHEMLEGYSQRFHYLRDVFYMRKQFMGKFKASVKSFFEAIVSPMPYKGMKILPSYPDSRLVYTINCSMKALDANMGVVIFPEDSNDGYKEEPTKFFAGFVVLAERYYKATGIDVPVIPTYYHKKQRKIIIGKPEFIQKLKKLGLKRDEIAEYFRKAVNSLFRKYIKAN
ncbi:MAG: hypothetical protein IKA61_02275 [Clostridia bacterium]|nr:hypothetical protein [Clostridia bacterium]